MKKSKKSKLQAEMTDLQRTIVSAETDLLDTFNDEKAAKIQGDIRKMRARIAEITELL